VLIGGAEVGVAGVGVGVVLGLGLGVITATELGLEEGDDGDGDGGGGGGFGRSSGRATFSTIPMFSLTCLCDAVWNWHAKLGYFIQNFSSTRVPRSFTLIPYLGNFFFHHINSNLHPIIFRNFQNYSYSKFKNSKK